MSSPSNDLAQLPINLFESGQAMMRQFTEANASDKAGQYDPMAAFMVGSQQIVGLQQDYWKQVAGFWSGISGVA